jgi:hypothetical protein
MTAAYYVVPTFTPFGDKIGALDQSLRVAAIDWRAARLIAGAPGRSPPYVAQPFRAARAARQA